MLRNYWKISVLGAFFGTWIGMMIEMSMVATMVIIIAIWSIITFSTVWVGVLIFIMWWVLKAAYWSVSGSLYYNDYDDL